MADPKKPVTKGPLKAAPKVDFELLTAEDKLRLQEDALAKARAERKIAAENEYSRIALEEARREEGLLEEMVTFRLELAEYANKLVIDGKTFFHGGTYTVPRSQYSFIMEMAYRTKTHQLEIDGKSKFKWQGWNDPRIGHDPRATIHGKVNTSNMPRV